jgi:hypothetical protein
MLRLINDLRMLRLISDLSHYIDERVKMLSHEFDGDGITYSDIRVGLGTVLGKGLMCQIRLPITHDQNCFLI